MNAGLDDRTLRRTIALLVSLAVLAERTAGRCLPVRWLVLAILRRAESVTRVHVFELTQADWPGFEDEPETGCRPVDATLLALRFRMLAAVLGVLLGQAGGVDDRDRDAAASTRRPAPRWLVAASVGCTAIPYDTS